MNMNTTKGIEITHRGLGIGYTNCFLTRTVCGFCLRNECWSAQLGLLNPCLCALEIVNAPRHYSFRRSGGKNVWMVRRVGCLCDLFWKWIKPRLCYTQNFNISKKLKLTRHQFGKVCLDVASDCGSDTEVFTNFKKKKGTVTNAPALCWSSFFIATDCNR